MDDNFRKPVALYRRKDAANKFIEAILTENDYCKKVMKNYFNKNLVMSAEYKTKFQSNAWDAMLKMTEIESELI